MTTTSLLPTTPIKACTCVCATNSTRRRSDRWGRGPDERAPPDALARRVAPRAGAPRRGIGERVVLVHDHLVADVLYRHQRLAEPGVQLPVLQHPQHNGGGGALGENRQPPPGLTPPGGKREGPASAW